MAKQVIGTGASPNDGTGDPIRNAMIKINENFDELYDGQFSGAYADLTGKPALANVAITGAYTDLTGRPNIPTDLTDLGIVDGTDGQVLTTDGSGVFTFETISGGGGGGLSNSEIVDLITGSDLDMSGNRVLFANRYDTVGDLPNATTYHGMFAHVHADGTAYFAHSGNWVRLANASELSGASGLQTRTTKTGTTASLANDAVGNLDITGFKSYSLMAIQTDKAAWVRIYANGASRTADASRAETSDPAPDAGVIAEVITTGAQTVLISPGVFGFNFESTPTTTIPCAIKNKSGSAGTVQVTLSLLQLEA